MQATIQHSLEHGYTYEKYRKIVSAMLAQGLSTGHTQSEELTHYSTLNETRMNRLERTISVPDDITLALQSLQHDYFWLVLSEGWCGDAAQLLPVFDKLANLTPAIDLRIAFRDENEDLMNLFLTGTAKSIPKLIIIKKSTMEVVGQFGPRPFEAAALVRDYKEKHAVIDETVKTALQLWYLHDKGLSTMNELVQLMKLADR